MVRELPGFYYDADKNRYFPCKGPLPGSRYRPPSVTAPLNTNEACSSCKVKTIKQDELLYARELCGNRILSRKGKFGFQGECRKIRAKNPVVTKFKGTTNLGHIALEHFVAEVATPIGLLKRDLLLGAGPSGSLSLSEIDRAIPERNSQQCYKFSPFFSPVVQEIQSLEAGFGKYSVKFLSSEISCMRKLAKNSFSPDGSLARHFLITTLGSDNGAPGSVWLLNLSKPLDFHIADPIDGAIFCLVGMFTETVWTADADYEGRKLAVGTDRGVVLLDSETRTSSRVLRYKSDVLALQFNPRGKLVLAGMRNGSILSLDPRRKHIRTQSSSLPSVKMPSSVCCLRSLREWDEYFLASSMDGSIRLYDYRCMERGPVQRYEGHVNSHSRMNLAVDGCEKVVASGGEDCCVRLWDIRSGELVFGKRVIDSVAPSVCWPESSGEGRREDHPWGVWLGTYDGFFYMDWS